MGEAGRCCQWDCEGVREAGNCHPSLTVGKGCGGTEASEGFESKLSSLELPDFILNKKKKRILGAIHRAGWNGLMLVALTCGIREL